MKKILVTEDQVEETDHRQRKILWHVLTEYPVLETSDLHIWRINLDDFIQIEHLTSLLSADEIARASRLIIPEKRKKFIVGRSLVRKILSLYTNRDAHTIRFKYLPNGKPLLAENTFSRQFQFNLSHSGSWLVLAVSQGVQVGIDIETIKPIENKNWALENLFADEIREKIRLLPDRLKDAAFIAVWTKMEAIGKTLGVGLSMSGNENIIDSVQNLELTDETYTVYQSKPFWLIRFSHASQCIGMAATLSNRKPRVHFLDFNASRFSNSIIRNIYQNNVTYPKRIGLKI